MLLLVGRGCYLETKKCVEPFRGVDRGGDVLVQCNDVDPEVRIWVGAFKQQACINQVGKRMTLACGTEGRVKNEFFWG